MANHKQSKVGPYTVDYYTDKKDNINVVTKLGKSKNPHTHEILGTDHADITFEDGSKTDKVITNLAFGMDFLKDS